MKKFLKNIVKLKKISTIKDFRFGTFPSISGSGYTFYRPPTTDEIIGSYQDRFTGLGKLKDFKLELHVDESIKPVAQTARKILFKMKKQLEHKLKDLEDSDVIEKVQGPTPWVSHLVVVPKANSDIRICVDMRCANKAVQRERFPMPNIEDKIQQMYFRDLIYLSHFIR